MAKKKKAKKKTESKESKKAKAAKKKADKVKAAAKAKADKLGAKNAKAAKAKAAATAGIDFKPDMAVNLTTGEHSAKGAGKVPGPRPKGAPAPSECLTEYETKTHFIYKLKNHKKVAIPK